jgi:orotate phosphoribosyltransferase
MSTNFGDSPGEITTGKSKASHIKQLRNSGFEVKKLLTKVTWKRYATTI